MNAILEVTALSAGYGASRVIRSVTIRAEQGEHHTIVGAPGAGKPTPELMSTCYLVRSAVVYGA
ncbi:hypothetical protein [Herbidospora sp. RD11066]